MMNNLLIFFILLTTLNSCQIVRMYALSIKNRSKVPVEVTYKKALGTSYLESRLPETIGTLNSTEDTLTLPTVVVPPNTKKRLPFSTYVVSLEIKGLPQKLVFSKKDIPKKVRNRCRYKYFAKGIIVVK